ncbi:putative E3 ubiquitin-protein ligase LIN isoform X2 [Rhododendron vialii]|uniref:putative E3 ubiquitin-protein ligase LIN isoform X2 n=1 Tax=Rhododendron vialii TaxID=182163 RepID=UPI00265D8DDA|nr:putative E3 ubiquitin-protein ligase LIN isoform X2 [Rhododendron vialii]
MASTSSSSSFLVSSHDKDRPNIESIRVIVASVNQHINEFLRDSQTRKSAKLKCTSKLNIQKTEFFEFSEQSTLSNLYWGIESIEAAVQSKCGEEKSLRLKNSEQMLQVPALLDENGVTAGIPNRYLVSSSYFYLCLVRKLQGDEWQVALHLLQAVLVSPRVVWTQFVPKLCESLFVSCMASERREMAGRSLKSEVLVDFDEGEMGEKTADMARRYKAWLTYYQVMSYGELPKRNSGCGDIALANDDSQFFENRKATGTESSNVQEYEKRLLSYRNVHPLDPQGYITPITSKKSKVSDIVELEDPTEAHTDSEQVYSEPEARTSSKCLQDLLTESQSDTPISENSYSSSSSDDDDFEVYTGDTGTSKKKVIKADIPRPRISNQKQVAPCSKLGPEFAISLPRAPGNLAHEEYITNSYTERCYRSFSAFELSILELREIDSFTPSKSHEEEGRPDQRSLHQHDLQTFDNLKSTSLKTYHFTQMDQKRSSKRSIKRSKQNQYFPRKPTRVCSHPQNGSEIEFLGILEKAISKLCFSEGLGRFDEDHTVEIVRTYEMLSNKRGVKYTLVKDIILDQLLTAISTSKEVRVIRASVAILSTLASVNKGVIQDINKNGLPLCNLASALKRNVHEAAVLIYLINPPPAAIKTLELLPTLVEVVSTSKRYKGGLASLLPTPPAASLMIIEVLVTSFDYGTNNMHLAAINSPRVLSGLLNAPRNNNMEDFTSLATILVKCMRFDGQCRKYISKSAPVGPFLSLLRSNQERAKFIALEFFNEILCMPRSSATNVLRQIQKEGSVNNMHILALLIQQSEREYKLLAANLLLHLDILEDSPGKSTYTEEAVEALAEPLTSVENSATQQLSTFLLSNLGGTYAWTGEPYTVAWLLKKTGLATQHHRNMIRNFNWLDPTLQDSATDTWCEKIARSVTKTGEPVFHALKTGLNSEIKKVSRECLTIIAWVGCGIARTQDNLRHTACEILLTAVEQFLHPGLELEERLLACLCIYNYASGKGMQKLIHFSEGVKESLRRLSNITWMAEELLRVANFFLPNKWRISCVHTQVLEATQNYSGAVTALIYYKGQLCSGYADGSIKVWDIKGQTATLVLDMKEHKKAVTCFSLFEPGDCMLSGSADKTIRIWQMVRRKLECIEVIGMKESIQSLDTSGQLIFTVTQSHELKVIDSSRKARDLYKSKPVKCVRVIQGKVYVGCMDSSIQELAIENNREREIKPPSKIWMIQSRPVNSISVYKDWLYSASAVVDGSNIKEWRRQSKPQMSLLPDRGTNVLAMEVVEDFIYLNCSSSRSVLQIWLRGTQQKVGRLSAGSKITSVLTGNDVVLCGTERGLIKGWIPL